MYRLKYRIIVILLGIAAMQAAQGVDNSRVKDMLLPKLCSDTTTRLIVFEDRSYKCVGGKIILYIDNER